MMSIHSSKGLEFKHLFIIGLEEDFFQLLEMAQIWKKRDD